jgi:hypothetical protein
MSDQLPEQQPPTIPPRVRTWAYGIGLVAVPLAGALAADVPLASAILAAIGTGSLGIAFGYRPTR